MKLTYDIVDRTCRRRSLTLEKINFKQDGVKYRYRIDDGNGTTIDCENLEEAYSEAHSYPVTLAG